MQTMALAGELREGDMLSGDQRLKVLKIEPNEEPLFADSEVVVTVQTSRGEERRLNLPARLPLVIEVAVKPLEEGGR